MTLPPLVDPPLPYDPDAILAAEEMVRSYCGWHIAPSITETLTLDGNGGTVLVLPSLHITAITSIVEDGSTVSASGYSWSPEGVLERNTRWLRKYGAIQVTLTHGYDKCPPAVRREVARLAAAGYTSSQNVTQAQIGQVQLTYGSTSPAFEALGRYQLPGLV